MKKKDLQETEKRAILTTYQRRNLPSKLKQIGAIYKGSSTIKDIYFCPKEVSSLREVEMNKIGSYSLRVRSKIVGSETIAELNMKVITTYGDHNSWKEHEVKIDSQEEMINILKALGFKSFLSIEKTRSSYQYDQFNVEIEDIKDYSSILEVETFAGIDFVAEAKSKIDDLFQKLKVTDEQIVPKSITNIIMKEKAIF